MTDWQHLLKHASPDVRELNADVIDGKQPKPVQAQPVTVDSPLAAQFEDLWRHLHGPTLDTEVRFHAKRKWRLDYCHLPTRTAIELEGGAYSKGRHTRGKGFVQDCEKYNAAAALGYTVFRLATGMVTPKHVGQIIEYINGRQKEQTK